jgi:hypothetical protein
LIEGNQTRVQLSVKFGANGSGYAIVEAATVAELIEQAGALMDQAGYINSVVEEIQARSAFANAGVETTQVQAPQNPGTPSGPPVENCAHGVPRKFVAGTSKAGKPYRALFCQVQNDPNLAECKPKFLN